MDVATTIDLTQDDQQKFADFMAWVSNYNEYIINTYAEKATSKQDEDLDAIDVDDLIEQEVA